MSDTDAKPLLAGVELGGTKAIAVLGRGGAIVERSSVPTTDPATTLGTVSMILSAWRAEHGAPAALGIASFGPVAVSPGAPDYGHILPTPKAGWTGADVVGGLKGATDGPVVIHTDVTAAALAERRFGAATGCDDLVYITIGTGIGGGVIANGAPVEGAMHPEIGHLPVRRRAGDGFAGACPVHGECLEGLASGPAIAARAGRPAEELTPDDPVWRAVADDLGEGLASLFLTLAPQRIVLGGGVGVGQPQLLPMIRDRVAAVLAGYLPFANRAALDALIVPAALGGDAGPIGALLLAERALA